MRLLFSNRKASNFAPLVTTGVVLFNVFLFIIISAFASDSVSVGTANNIYGDIDEVNATYDTTSVAKPSFLSGFAMTISNLPWWFNVFVVFVNLLLIPITVLAWVRGL